MTAKLVNLLPDRFILAMLGAIGLASLLPAQGVWADAVSSMATLAVTVLFFLHGARLPREALVAGLTHWRLHLTILLITFMAFPLIGVGMVSTAPDILPSTLWLGVLFLCVMPSTVQSSIAFTSIGKGNVAAAVTAAAASNVIGVILAPLLAGIFAHAHNNVAPMSSISKIVLQLLLPFLIGHLMNPLIGPWVIRQKKLVTAIDRGTIILAVYSAFSAAVLNGVWSLVSGRTLAILLIVCVALFFSILIISWFAAKLLGFSRQDRTTILFCGSTKSLASGVPMARVLFPGSEAGLIILPLMIFHQLQLMACAWIARRLHSVSDEDPSATKQLTDTLVSKEKSL